MKSFEDAATTNIAEINEKDFVHEEKIEHGKMLQVGAEFVQSDGQPYADGLYTNVSAKGEHGVFTRCFLIKEGKIVDAVNIKGDYPETAGQKSETIWVGQIHTTETLRDIQSGKWKVSYDQVEKHV